MHRDFASHGTKLWKLTTSNTFKRCLERKVEKIELWAFFSWFLWSEFSSQHPPRVFFFLGWTTRRNQKQNFLPIRPAKVLSSLCVCKRESLMVFVLLWIYFVLRYVTFNFIFHIIFCIPRWKCHRQNKFKELIRIEHLSNRRWEMECRSCVVLLSEAWGQKKDPFESFSSTEKHVVRSLNSVLLVS